MNEGVNGASYLLLLRSV